MVSYDISKVWSFLPTLVQALPATLALMVLTTLLGSAFGLVLTWAQVSEEKVGAGLAKGYDFHITRSGTPWFDIPMLGYVSSFMSSLYGKCVVISS